MRRNLLSTLLVTATAVAIQSCSGPAEKKLDDDGLANLPQGAYVETPLSKANDALEVRIESQLRDGNFKELDAVGTRCLSSRPLPPYDSDRLDLFYYHLASASDSKITMNGTKDRLKRLEEWSKARPDSIFAPIAMAMEYLLIAHINSEGLVDKDIVDRSYFDKGKQLLEKSKSLAKKNPWWYVLSMNYEFEEKGEITPKFLALEKEGAAAFPHYKRILETRYLVLLKGTNKPGWLKAVTETADKLGGTAGDAFYARAIGTAVMYYNEANPDFSEISWERVDRGLGEIEKKYPSSIELLNSRCLLAVVRKDLPQAKELFEKIGGRPTRSVWPDLPTFRGIRRMVYKQLAEKDKKESGDKPETKSADKSANESTNKPESKADEKPHH